MKKLILLAALCLLAGPACADPGSLFNINATTAPVITCTTTSSNVAFGNPNILNVRIYNSGSAAVFVVTGDSTVSATFPTSSAVAGSVIAPGAIESFQKSPGHTHIACDAASSSNTVYVQSGSGE